MEGWNRQAIATNEPVCVAEGLQTKEEHALVGLHANCCNLELNHVLNCFTLPKATRCRLAVKDPTRMFHERPQL